MRTQQKNKMLKQLPIHEHLLHRINGARCKIKREVTTSPNYLKMLNKKARIEFKRLAEIVWLGKKLSHEKTE